MVSKHNLLWISYEAQLTAPSSRSLHHVGSKNGTRCNVVFVIEKGVLDKRRRNERTIIDALQEIRAELDMLKPQTNHAPPSYEATGSRN